MILEALPPSRSNAVVLQFDDPTRAVASDVVYLHGRGSSEREGAQLVKAFPGARLRSYRAPLRQGGGYAWFANESIGVARPESLAAEIPKVADWIRSDSGAHAPWLCGFSNGCAMAASLALADPGAYAGLVMIGGPFAIDELPSNGLRGMPVLFCYGRFDSVIPTAKYDQARDYLAQHSGAELDIILHQGAHEIPPSLIPAIAAWFESQPA